MPTLAQKLSFASLRTIDGVGEVHWICLGTRRVPAHQFPIISPCGTLIIENVFVAVAALFPVIIVDDLGEEGVMKAVAIPCMFVIVPVANVNLRALIRVIFIVVSVILVILTTST